MANGDGDSGPKFDQILPIAQINETQKLGLRVQGDERGIASVDLGIMGADPSGTAPEGAEELRVEEVPGSPVSFQVIGKAGPAKVNTREFQTGWDRIFGEKSPGKA